MDKQEIILKDFEIITTQKPGIAKFDNFDSIKKLLQKKLSIYKTSSYNSSTLKEAENDLKELKSIKKVLSDKKKEIEHIYSMPIEEVKDKFNELIEMVKEPLDFLDKLVTDNYRKEKEKEIYNYAKINSEKLGKASNKIINSPAFFNDKWLNKTYKEKDWKKDVDTIITKAIDDIDTIEKAGGTNKKALLGFYYQNLSLDDANSFIDVLNDDSQIDFDTNDNNDDDKVVGYKVLKIFGTQKQMLKLMDQLELSEIDFEELEDGMPKDMEEIFEPDFDSYVCFDIEHTGTFGIGRGDDPSEIIEIGAVKVVKGEITDKFDMLCNPGRKITPMVERLTHITNDMVKNEPNIDEVIKQFYKFAKDSILVGHNIKSCDIPHIVRAAKRVGISFDNKFLDTKTLANKFKDKNKWENIKLEYLANYYKIQQSDAHRAWCDAEANAYVYLKLKDEK